MVGSATLTTRLSSTTMNSATETMPNVQPFLREMPLIFCSFRGSAAILAVANNNLGYGLSAARIASIGYLAGWCRAWLERAAQARSARSRGEYSADNAKDDPTDDLGGAVRGRGDAARGVRLGHEDGDEGQRAAIDSVDGDADAAEHDAEDEHAGALVDDQDEHVDAVDEHARGAGAGVHAGRKQERRTERGIGDGPREGFTPSDTSDYHSDQALRVLVGTRTGSGDGYGQQAFFFVNGRYIGTDTKDTSATLKVISQGDTEVTLGYPLYRKSDPLSSPSGGETHVTFQLNNGKLTPLGKIPPSSSSSGLSRQ